MNTPRVASNLTAGQAKFAESLTLPGSTAAPQGLNAEQTARHAELQSRVRWTDAEKAEYFQLEHARRGDPTPATPGQSGGLTPGQAAFAGSLKMPGRD